MFLDTLSNRSFFHSRTTDPVRFRKLLLIMTMADGNMRSNLYPGPGNMNARSTPATVRYWHTKGNPFTTEQAICRRMSGPLVGDVTSKPSKGPVRLHRPFETLPKYTLTLTSLLDDHILPIARSGGPA